MTYKVGYFVGSLAAGSINRILSRALIKVAPADLEFVEIPIKDLPLYSFDYDADYPPAGHALKEAIAGVNAVLFVSPEYNRARSRTPSTGPRGRRAPTPSPANPRPSSAPRPARSGRP